MDKETLSHYGWIVIVSLVLAIMIALATPFGVFVGKAVSNTVRGFAGTAQTKFDGSDFDADQFELDYNKDKQEWEGTKSSATNGEAGSIIPDGAKYTVKATNTILEGNGTNKFPDTPATNDTYEYGDYVYTYNKGGDYGSDWSVQVKDTSKTSYGEILSEIAGKPITNMYQTFYYCTELTTAPVIPNSVTDMNLTFFTCISLTTAPAIPNSVTNMSATFMSCSSLTNAPAIPSSVTNMQYTFIDCNSLTTPPDMSNASNVTNMQETFNRCSSLTTAPTIPSSVTNMSGTFMSCVSLTGIIEINANPTSYDSCFCYADKEITLVGSSTMLNELASTATSENVTVGTANNGNVTVDIRKTIQAGTYTFKNKLSKPDADYNENISLDFNGKNAGDTIKSIQVNSTTLAYMTEMGFYIAYNFNNNQWSTEKPNINTITIASDTVVSEGFYNWFTNNLA